MYNIIYSAVVYCHSVPYIAVTHCMHWYAQTHYICRNTRNVRSIGQGRDHVWNVVYLWNVVDTQLIHLCQQHVYAPSTPPRRLRVLAFAKDWFLLTNLEEGNNSATAESCTKVVHKLGCSKWFPPPVRPLTAMEELIEHRETRCIKWHVYFKVIVTVMVTLNSLIEVPRHLAPSRL